MQRFIICTAVLLLAACALLWWFSEIPVSLQASPPDDMRVFKAGYETGYRAAMKAATNRTEAK